MTMNYSFIIFNLILYLSDYSSRDIKIQIKRRYTALIKANYQTESCRDSADPMFLRRLV